MPHRFHPDHMGRLESAERARRQPPERVLEAVGVAPGWRLADVGCGPGFYALPAARMVGPAGEVYALDLEERMLARVRERAAAEGLANVRTLRSEEARLPLADGAVDAVLVANVLHECTDRVALLREARRALAPGGRIALVEWRRDGPPMGPPQGERLTEEQVAQDLQEAGFGPPAPLAGEGLGATHFGVLAPRDGA